MPAPPFAAGGDYVAAAYIVFLALIGVYVAIMAVRQARIQQDVEELARLVEEREASSANGSHTVSEEVRAR